MRSGLFVVLMLGILGSMGMACAEKPPLERHQYIVELYQPLDDGAIEPLLKTWSGSAEGSAQLVRSAGTRLILSIESANMEQWIGIIGADPRVDYIEADTIMRPMR